MRWLCKLGLHDKQWSYKFHPHIGADVVTHMDFKCWCSRCGKIFADDTDYFEENLHEHNQ